jgi:hypothetical protein
MEGRYAIKALSRDAGTTGRETARDQLNAYWAIGCLGALKRLEKLEYHCQLTAEPVRRTSMFNYGVSAN